MFSITKYTQFCDASAIKCGSDCDNDFIFVSFEVFFPIADKLELFFRDTAVTITREFFIKFLRYRQRWSQKILV